jgi:hypothetical protein
MGGFNITIDFPVKDEKGPNVSQLVRIHLVLLVPNQNGFFI